MAWKIQHLEVDALQNAILTGAYSVADAMEIAATLKSDEHREFFEDVARATIEGLQESISVNSSLADVVVILVKVYSLG